MAPVASTTSVLALDLAVAARPASVTLERGERAGDGPAGGDRRLRSPGAAAQRASGWRSSSAPVGPWWTTRSPPMTRSPLSVRSKRVWVVPSASTMVPRSTKPWPCGRAGDARVLGREAARARRSVPGGGGAPWALAAGSERQRGHGGEAEGGTRRVLSILRIRCRPPWQVGPRSPQWAAARTAPNDDVTWVTRRRGRASVERQEGSSPTVSPGWSAISAGPSARPA